VELLRESKIAGYLALLVGTQKRGLTKEGAGLYFGYAEHAGTKRGFKRLRDVLKLKQPHGRALQRMQSLSGLLHRQLGRGRCMPGVPAANDVLSVSYRRAAPARDRANKRGGRRKK
jgi:hypothetical protein